MMGGPGEHGGRGSIGQKHFSHFFVLHVSDRLEPAAMVLSVGKVALIVQISRLIIHFQGVRLPKNQSKATLFIQLSAFETDSFTKMMSSILP